MGQIGHSTTLKTLTTPQTIGDIINVTGPNQSRAAIETTAFDSADHAKEFITGLADAGEITFTLNYEGDTGGSPDILNDLMINRTIESWEIEYPLNTGSASKAKDVVSGFITSMTKAVPNGEKITQDVTIKLTGKVTFTDET